MISRKNIKLHGCIAYMAQLCNSSKIKCNFQCNFNATLFLNALSISVLARNSKCNSCAISYKKPCNLIKHMGHIMNDYNLGNCFYDENIDKASRIIKAKRKRKRQLSDKRKEALALLVKQNLGKSKKVDDIIEKLSKSIA